MAEPQDSAAFSFVDMEHDVLAFWEANGTFKQSLDNTREKKPYIFYDGPPFATGLPHHGHLVASTIKDIVPRYWTMKGRYVLRHPWTGETQCQQADAYRRGLPQRFDREARTLATLAGWSIADIRTWAKLPVPPAVPDDPWWKTLWPAAGGR